jgi:hypothetical protein
VPQLAGQRVTLLIEGPLTAVLGHDGSLLRALGCLVPAPSVTGCAAPAAPGPPTAAGPYHRAAAGLLPGGIMVARQKIHVICEKANATDRRSLTRLTPEDGDPMPEVRLDAAGAAEMLRFLTGGLAPDPTRLGASLATLPATPPTAPPSCAT